MCIWAAVFGKRYPQTMRFAQIASFPAWRLASGKTIPPTIAKTRPASQQLAGRVDSFCLC